MALSTEQREINTIYDLIKPTYPLIPLSSLNIRNMNPLIHILTNGITRHTFCNITDLFQYLNRTEHDAVCVIGWRTYIIKKHASGTFHVETVSGVHVLFDEFYNIIVKILKD